MLQLQHTPPPQSTTSGLHPVSIHQMAPPVRGSKHPITAYYSVWRPRKVERLSRPGWLVTYRNKLPPPGVEPIHVTHPSINRARRRVTSLIRPTPLPLRHAANQNVGYLQLTCWSSYPEEKLQRWIIDTYADCVSVVQTTASNRCCVNFEHRNSMNVIPFSLFHLHRSG